MIAALKSLRVILFLDWIFTSLTLPLLIVDIFINLLLRTKINKFANQYTHLNAKVMNNRILIGFIS